MKQIIFILSLFIGFTACNESSTNSSDATAVIQNVSVAEFKTLLEKEGHLIDVRTPGEYEAGHIEGATLINVNGSDFKQRTKVLDKNTPVYVYCRSGKRSLKAASILKDQGFTKVYNLKGGYIDWAKEIK